MLDPLDVPVSRLDGIGPRRAAELESGGIRSVGDFLYRITTGRLVNPWVSSQMKSFLARQLDTTKLAAGLPRSAMFSHKTGWYSYWTNDAGIVEEGDLRYIVACFLPLSATAGEASR